MKIIKSFSDEESSCEFLWGCYLEIATIKAVKVRNVQCNYGKFQLTLEEPVMNFNEM